MDEERLQRMMSDPNVQQSMNEALNNPDFINMLIDSNPMLRNIPNARELINSPFMRQMMSNPQMMTQALRMQRNMGRGESAFPAPGATDTTPADAPSTEGVAGLGGSQQQNPFGNPFMMPGLAGGAGGAGNFQQMLQNLNAMAGGAFPPPPSTGAATGTTGQQPTENRGTGETGGDAGVGQTQGTAAENPFAALFPPPAAGAGAGGANPFALSPEQFQQMMQMFSPPQAAAAPADNRPPEERYAEQLRQLNDMGFYDFDRNVAALRRSGGSVQGAVEHLLGGTN
jgi:ubiquilin